MSDKMELLGVKKIDKLIRNNPVLSEHEDGLAYFKGLLPKSFSVVILYKYSDSMALIEVHPFNFLFFSNQRHSNRDETGHMPIRK